MAKLSIDLAVIEAEIERIRSLGLDDLRTEWCRMLGVVPPAGLTKDILGRMIAYRLQEQALGGLDRETSKLLDRLAGGERAGKELNRRLKAGTVLIREYQGKRHEVTVVPEGYICQGTTYASLSAIARAITGTSWNGPRYARLPLRRAGWRCGHEACPFQGTALRDLHP